MNSPLRFSPYVLPGWQRAWVDTTDTTMLRLRERAAGGGSGAGFELLTAEYQTAGRGRPGRSWEADHGRNLLFGMLFHPDFLPAARQFRLSQILALSVAEALDGYVAGVTVKWPNDVYVGNGKICGMLLEHTLRGAVISTTVTGVGLNVNQREFRSSAPNPVSLAQLTGREQDREALLLEICSRFASRFSDLREGMEGSVHAAYMERLYRREGFYRYRDAAGEFEAIPDSVSPMGPITLRDRQGRLRTYNFGEVAHLIP